MDSVPNQKDYEIHLNLKPIRLRYLIGRCVNATARKLDIRVELVPNLRKEEFYMLALSKGLGLKWAKPPEKSETPDFLCVLDSCNIGVELTEFHLPQQTGRRPHQEQSALRNQIVELAEQLYEESLGPPLYVTIFFRDEIEFKKSEVQAQARAICGALLHTNVPRNFSESITEVHWHNLPKEVTNIRVCGSIDGVNKLWYASSGGWVTQIKPSHIQEVLDKKAGSLSRARLKCDKIWIVIVEDPFGLGAPAEISEEAKKTTYEVIADRLLWLKPCAVKVIELSRYET